VVVFDEPSNSSQPKRLYVEAAGVIGDLLGHLEATFERLAKLRAIR
jgi:hypothetical protein